MEDPDSTWGLADEIVPSSPPPSEHLVLSPRRASLAPSIGSESSTTPYHGDSRSHLALPYSDSTSKLDDYLRSSSDFGTITQTSDPNSMDPSAGPSSISTGAGISRVGTKKGQVAELLRLSNLLLESNEEAVAVQITRIAWEAFSEITVSLRSDLQHWD
jgi:hypothetical protein